MVGEGRAVVLSGSVTRSAGDLIHGLIRGIGLSNDFIGDLLAPGS